MRPPHDDTRTDQELIAAINQSDDSAFEALYFRYRDWVVNVAYQLTSDSHSSLDVMQETFLYLARKFPGFILTCQLKTFLYPAVRHLSIAARRKAARLEPADNWEQLAAEPASDEHHIDQERRELSAVLSTLTEDHREVLLLRFVDRLSLAEIAQALAVPLGTVKSRLHHALGTLRHDGRTRKFFFQ